MVTIRSFSKITICVLSTCYFTVGSYTSCEATQQNGDQRSEKEKKISIFIRT